jgi:hypothetical protein
MAYNAQMKIFIQQLKDLGLEESAMDYYREKFISSQKAQYDDILGNSTSSSERHIVLDKETSLNTAEQWAVACSADLTFFYGWPLNTLSLKMTKDKIKEFLSVLWGIENRKDLEDKLRKMAEEGDHVDFEIYMEAYSMQDVENAKNMLFQHFKDKELTITRFHNIRAAYEQMVEDGLLPDNSTYPNLLSWDLARVILLSRAGYDAGYIDEKDAMNVIMRTARKIQPAYNSWKEMSIGYQFGRYMWSGNSQYQMLLIGMKELLSDEDSPWIKLDWNTPLK